LSDITGTKIEKWHAINNMDSGRLIPGRWIVSIKHFQARSLCTLAGSNRSIDLKGGRTERRVGRSSREGSGKQVGQTECHGIGEEEEKEREEGRFNRWGVMM